MVGQQIEATVLRFDQDELHGLAASNAGQFSSGSKPGASWRRPGGVQHRVLNPFRAVDATLPNGWEDTDYV